MRFEALSPRVLCAKPSSVSVSDDSTAQTVLALVPEVIDRGQVEPSSCSPYLNRRRDARCSPVRLTAPWLLAVAVLSFVAVVAWPSSASAEESAFFTNDVPVGARVGTDGAATSNVDGFSGAACRSNSFVPGTRVLMADGSTKPIEDVEIGDRVRALDPETGEGGGRVVTDVIVGDGRKDLVQVSVLGDEGRQSIVATAKHPFWVADDGSWVDAADLEVGDLLLDADGSTIEILAVVDFSAVQRVHNLTVDGIHTYFVTAGGDTALVDNCGDLNAVSATNKGWSVGDDVYAQTVKGTDPKWSTVRSRFWKNEANNPVIDAWDDANLARMEKGLAPQRYNPAKGGIEKMELSHEPIPFRDGGRDFVPRWPQDDAVVDPWRRTGY